MCCTVRRRFLPRPDMASSRSVEMTQESKLGWRGQPVSLTDNQLSVLNRLMDGLIPCSGGFPAPSAVGVAEDFVALCLGDESADMPGRLSTAVFLERIARLAEGELSQWTSIDEALLHLDQNEQEFFHFLLILTYYGYYSRAPVIDRIRRDVPGGRDYQPTPQPAGYDAAGTNWSQIVLPQRGSYIPTEKVAPLVRPRVQDVGD
jgi:hypothetical protein